MAKKKKVKRKSRPIVTGHIEKVGRGIFDKYQKQITDMIKGQAYKRLVILEIQRQKRQPCEA